MRPPTPMSTAKEAFFVANYPDGSKLELVLYLGSVKVILTDRQACQRFSFLAANWFQAAIALHLRRQGRKAEANAWAKLTERPGQYLPYLLLRSVRFFNQTFSAIQQQQALRRSLRWHLRKRQTGRLGQSSTFVVLRNIATAQAHQVAGTLATHLPRGLG